MSGWKKAEKVLPPVGEVVEVSGLDFGVGPKRHFLNAIMRENKSIYSLTNEYFPLAYITHWREDKNGSSHKNRLKASQISTKTRS